MKVALVHDQLNEFGGAERVLLALSEIWPSAPIYTAYFKNHFPAWEWFKDKQVKVSWMQSMSKLASPLRFLAPAVWNSFDFSSYDVIIGSASWYITKGFKKKNPRAIEICYCHTPPRWLYGYTTSQQNLLTKTYGTIVGFFLRQYDFRASQRVNYFLANSQETKARIKKFYRRDAIVVYPPIELAGPPSKTQKRNYFLIVSRLAQPKNVELGIRVANQLKLPLKIVGTGPDEERLKKLAGPTVEFLGFVADNQLPQIYAGAKAFLALATDEDFGMTPVEAMAYGTPSIAFRGAGYLESVVEGKTGVFFNKPEVNDLKIAVQKFENVNRKLKKEMEKNCFNQAKKFSKARFKQEIKKFVEDKWQNK